MKPNDQWIGAVLASPVPVTGEGPAFHPAVVIWVDAASRYVLATKMVHPAETTEALNAALREALGQHGAPKKLRVAKRAIAAMLATDLPVVVAATPEIADLERSMRDHLTKQAEPTYLEGDVAAEDVAAFFAAAASLHRAAPWSVIPADAALGVRCAALGIDQGVILVVGQMQQSFGFSLFATEEAGLLYMDAAEAGDRSRIPSHVMVSFEPRREMPKALVDEVATHRWLLAGADAYPSPMVVDDHGGSRNVTRAELHGLAAIMTTLAELVATRPELGRAWDAGAGALTYSANAVTLKVLPFEASYVDELLARFPTMGGELRSLVEMLASHLLELSDVELDRATNADLELLLFGHLPRQISIAADKAPLVLAAARAVVGTPDGIALLDHPDTAKRLAEALANERLYGPAKSVVMQGIREGFAMDTEAGMRAWFDELARRQPRPKARPPTKKKRKR